MSKTWQAYAHHILDVGAKIERIQARGDLTQDEVLYDAALRDILVHNYLGDIDPLTVQAILDRHLPQIIKSVQTLLAMDDPSPV